ncbi:protein TolR [Acinetobacter puyangensis]|uniref:Tol-Pal system protein TolR n=1 Tax=Acinetobacter puyangensis TaxID=1096779 RepID=A0A240E6L1_9GAMM|nr:Cell division and transport-associated protein TolR [Acinetobacter puyangensis]
MARRNSSFTRIKKPLKSDMNVVPYIDVMLVLLVIFMVTAPMITSSVNVDLPKVHSQDQGSDASAAIYVVSIDKEGQFSLQDQENTATNLSLDEIQEKLVDAFAQNPEIKVMIQGDQAISYGQVMQLMSNLQQAGLKQVGLVTQPLK